MAIDKARRKLLATNLAALISGEITNKEFDERVWVNHPSDDAGVRAIEYFAWCLYDDFKTHRLIDEFALHPVAMETATRTLMFLHTTTEYEWPRRVDAPLPLKRIWHYIAFGLLGSMLAACGHQQGGDGGAILVILGAVLTLPLPYWAITFRGKRNRNRQFMSAGDFEVWPFLRRADYEMAAKNSPGTFHKD